MDRKNLETLREMQEKIECIKACAQQLLSLGKGVPAVETNARCILTAVYLLKFGVSDILQVQEAQAGCSETCAEDCAGRL